MTFGKHKDEEISELPSGYLKWLMTIGHGEFSPAAKDILLGRMILEHRFDDEEMPDYLNCAEEF